MNSQLSAYFHYPNWMLQKYLILLEQYNKTRPILAKYFSFKLIPSASQRRLRKCQHCQGLWCLIDVCRLRLGPVFFHYDVKDVIDMSTPLQWGRLRACLPLCSFFAVFVQTVKLNMSLTNIKSTWLKKLARLWKTRVDKGICEHYIVDMKKYGNPV